MSVLYQLLLFMLLLSSIISLRTKTGTIYKLQCQVTGKVYIGRTIRGVESAMKHNINLFESYKRGTYKDNLAVFDVLTNNNCSVTVLEILYELANDRDFKMRLSKRQRYYIDQYDNVINKCIPTRTKKEYDKDNRDRFSQYYKDYYKDNRETVLQRYQQNKSKLLEKVTCEVCGGTYSKASLWKHNRTIRHLTALAKLNNGPEPESGPQYQQQLSKLLGTVKVTCEVCGGGYNKGALWNHKQTKRHLTALAKLTSGSDSGPQYQQQLNELMSNRTETCKTCGGEYAKVSLWYHNRSKRHIRALAKLTNQGTYL